MDENSRPDLIRLLEFIDGLRENIFNQYLSNLQYPTWALPKNYYKNRLAKYLQRVYENRSTTDRQFAEIGVPKNLPLAVAIYFVTAMDGIYIYIFILVTNLRLIPDLWDQSKLILLSTLFLVILLYSSIGAYWTIIEIISNKNLTKRTKLICVFFMIVCIYVWIALGSQRTWREWGVELGNFSGAINFLGQTYTYQTLSIIFIYIPVLTHAGIWLTKSIYSFGTTVRNVSHWLNKIPTLQSSEETIQFLTTPVQITEGNMTLIELEKNEISTIQNWANSRQQVIQNKLIPITLFIAILALIFSTVLGDQFIEYAQGVFEDYFVNDHKSIWDYTVTWIQMILIMAFVLLPMSKTVKLLNESFVTDFMKDVCVFALHLKEETKESPSPSKGFIACLKEFFK